MVILNVAERGQPQGIAPTSPRIEPIFGQPQGIALIESGMDIVHKTIDNY
ncbi:MAG: hypothetical protein ABFS56_10535 [Pseudomonadota bacterium]